MAPPVLGMLATAVVPPPSLPLLKRQLQAPPMTTTTGAGGLWVECSSRPQKKATAHHMKTRPKKTQPWDRNRKGPTPYPPLPALPPDWTIVANGEEPPSQLMPQEEAAEAEEVAVTVASP